MADFPTAFTSAIPEITPIMAKHLNNLEIKVGIDLDPNVLSLDYMVRARVTNSIFGTDHDIVTGYHKLGAWHIGIDLVTASAIELNKLTGTSANVTPANLSALVDGNDAGIGIGSHRHDAYRVPDNKSLSSPYWGGTYPNLNPLSKRVGFLCFWFDYNTSKIYLLPKMNGILTNLRIKFSVSGAHFDTVKAELWDNNNANIDKIDWGGADGPFTYPTNPANTGTDKFYWGGTNQECEIIYNEAGSGDACILHLHTFGPDWKQTEITAEVVSNGGNQAFDQIIIGTMPAAAGWGNQDHKIIFNLGGKVLEIL